MRRFTQNLVIAAVLTPAACFVAFCLLLALAGL